MAFDITEFRGKLVGGGARPNLFQVILSAPAYVGLNTEQLSFMCKASEHPASFVGKVPEYYFGRPVYLGGDRVFEEWRIAIINDEPFDIRSQMETWSSSIASHSTTNDALRGLGATSNPMSYVGSGQIIQYGKDGSVLQTYNLVNVWPTQIGAIQLAWDQDNRIEEFMCSLVFDYFTTSSGSVV